MKNFILFFTTLLCTTAYASSCQEQYTMVQNELESRYGISTLRAVTQKVFTALSAAEKQEIAALSKEFNSTPFNTPEQQQNHFALQARARTIVRAAVSRAGYPILNADEGNPFDAVIAQKNSSDGFEESMIEVRSLLIRKNPSPHATLWIERNDPAHNPFHIVSLGIMNDAQDDYASWRPSSGTGRISGTMEQLIRSLLPENCH